MSWREKLSVFAVGLIAAGCASTGDAPSSVLEPVVESVADAYPAESAPKPADPLLEQLKALGYQGLGLEFEDPATLELLQKVFSYPETHGLDLKLVYTGLRMQYDATQKSITIGGMKDPALIVAYIKRHVPRAPAAPVATPPPSPTPSPGASLAPSPTRKSATEAPPLLIESSFD
jgi:hypothetical protein